MKCLTLRKKDLFASTSLSATAFVFVGVFSVMSAHAQQAVVPPEFNASRALEQINALGAYNLGFTGKGVTVGVVDSGIDLRHPEFATAGKILGGIKFNAAFDINALDASSYVPLTLGENNDYDPVNKAKQDPGGHGTAVASYVAGAKDGVGMQGSAYNASLYIAAISMGAGASFENGLDTQISISTRNMVDNGVKIINYSLGRNDTDKCAKGALPIGLLCNVDQYNQTTLARDLPTLAAAGQYAVNKGALLIFATGNEKQLSPDILAGLPKLVSGIQNGWLAVGAVGSNGVITDYSNRCGSAKDWCLVAPGNLAGAAVLGNVVAAGADIDPLGQNYNSGEGTSYAAPTVAGVAALAKEAFPWFTNYDLQQTLLTTATPLGSRTAGSITPDDVYGWGLVNAGAAVKGYGAFVRDTVLDTQGYNSTFGNNIFGPGGVTKSGAGTLTFTGNNTYTGKTTINGGALAVNGSIVSQVVVAQGGALGGSGQVGATTVNGTLGLGTPQTLTVNGNLTFGQTGIYLASIQGATSDLVKVNGSAALAGTLAPQTLGGVYTFNKGYTILTASSVNGQFATLDRSRVGVGLNISATYDSNAVQLIMTPGTLASAAQNLANSTLQPTSGANFVRVAAAIDRAASAGQNVDPLFNVYNSSSSQLASNLNQLTGEAHTATPQMGVTVSNQFLGAVANMYIEGREPSPSWTREFTGYSDLPRTQESSNPRATVKIDETNTLKGYTPSTPSTGPKYSFWASPVASYASIGGSASAASSRATSNGKQLVSGADIWLTPEVMVGIAVAGGTTSSTLANSLGTASADLAQFGAYGAYRTGALTVVGAGAFTWMDVTTHRSIHVLGLNDVRSRYQPILWSGRLESSYEVAKHFGIAFSPYAAIEAQITQTPRVVEKNTATGSAAIGGLTLQARNMATARTTLGFDMRGGGNVGNTPIEGFLRAGWVHYYNHDIQAKAFLTGISGSDFTVVGAKPKLNAAIASVGMKAQITPAITFTTSVDGEFSTRSQVYTGAVKFRIAF